MKLEKSVSDAKTDIQYESIDLFKCIFAVVVIMFHTNPIKDFPISLIIILKTLCAIWRYHFSLLHQAF